MSEQDILTAETINLSESIRKEIGDKEEIRAWRRKISAAYFRYEAGELPLEKWLSIMNGCVAKIQELEEFYDVFVERPKQPEPEKAEIEIPYEQMEFAY